MPDDEKPMPVYVYEWPEGVPLPEGAVDGHAEFLEGDEDFEYDPDFRPRRLVEGVHRGRPRRP